MQQTMEQAPLSMEELLAGLAGRGVMGLAILTAEAEAEQVGGMAEAEQAEIPETITVQIVLAEAAEAEAVLVQAALYVVVAEE